MSPLSLAYSFSPWLFAFQVEPQACPFPCQCPSQPLQCPAGTSCTWDACGCCRACAQQLGELCSLHRPCGHHKGFYCHFSKIHRGTHEDTTCDLLGKIYLNGESFQPTCKLQCICMDGAIGCIPLCSDDLCLPSPEGPNPRRVKFHSKCCEEWVCEESSEESRFGTAVAGQWGMWDGPELNKLCGMGISARVTNNNPQCRLEKETRLCMLRPCDFSTEKTKIHPRQRQRLHFEFSGCTSTHSYRPRFCCSCSDGCCCTPFLTSTVAMEFSCPEGDFFQRKMMFIKMCSCHYDCPRDNDIFLAMYHRRMIGDHVKAVQQ
uniref:Cellular communication network factor 2 n=1 Tax=Ficedula albicollis TaxID=59894 RepID=U3JF72_FICAL